MNTAGFLSGGYLCDLLGVSRTSIWKAVSALKEEGYQIEAVTNKGYRLMGRQDILSEFEVRKGLVLQWIGEKIVVLNQSVSTNYAAKELLEKDALDGTVVLANEQTSGRGRMNSGFYSPENTGLYCSILLRRQLHVNQLHYITILASEAVLDAVEEVCGFRPQIRWPSDIIYKGRKLCGILTEAGIEGETGLVHHLITGIGIHVNDTEFPNRNEQMISLRLVTGKPVNRIDLIHALLQYLDKAFSPEATGLQDGKRHRYEQDLFGIGQNVTLNGISSEEYGKLCGVGRNGGILIQNNHGEQAEYFSGNLYFETEKNK